MGREIRTDGQVYRVGIIGCGRMASTVDEEKQNRPGRVPQPVTLAEAYLQVPQTEVVAVADIGQAKLQAFSARWGVDRLYTDYREMLDAEGLDIVSVATHADLHCEMTVAAAEAGVRAVLCEKAVQRSACRWWIRPRRCPTRSIQADRDGFRIQKRRACWPLAFCAFNPWRIPTI